jgi:hypothetical protein
LTGEKDPRFVESGLRGARKRWAGHNPRVVRLDSLTAEQRRLVMALIEAAKSEPKAVEDVAA